MFFKKLLLIPLGLSLISVFNFSKKEFLFSDNQQISLVTEEKENKDFQVWLDEKFIEDENRNYLTNNDLPFHFYGEGDFSRFKKLEKINITNIQTPQTNPIVKIKFGENNEKVNEISFQADYIKSIKGLEYLLNLEKLVLGESFGYNGKEALLGINKINKNIKSIIISENRMSGEINLTNFLNLNELNLSFNKGWQSNLTVVLNKKYENGLPSNFNLRKIKAVYYDYATKDINDWLSSRDNSMTRLEYNKDSNENFEKLIGNGDFSNFKELKEIDLHGNGINGINFLNNNLITDVDLNDNNLQGEIDLSKLINLNILKLKENPELTKIKLNIKYKNNVVGWEMDNWDNVEYVDYNNNSSNNKSKSKAWVFILISLLIILIFGIGFYFYNKNKNKIS
jgi:hypothetical protein